MPNVITMSGPNPTQQIVSQFLEQFNANNRQREQSKMQQAQLDQSAQQHQDNFGLNQQKFDEVKQRAAEARAQLQDQAMIAQAQQVKANLAQQIDIMNTPGIDPQRKAAAEAVANQIKAQAMADPNLSKYVQLDAVESQLKSMSSEHLAKLGGDQTVAGMTGRAAQGGTAPEDISAALKVGPTGAYAPDNMFKQLQSNDLTARGAAGVPVPSAKAGIPAPSSNATSNYEAISTSQMPGSDNRLVAKTAIDTEAMRESGAMARQKSAEAAKASEVDPVQVVNLAAAVKGAVARNQDPNSVLKTIKNVHLHDAVVNALAEPGQGDVLQKSIGAAQQTALKDIEPLLLQAKKVMEAYAPYKDQNGLTDRDSIDYGLYMAGKKAPDNSPAAELANLQMLKVQAGTRLLKGGSRAMPALVMAMKHAGDGLIDTRANIYAKTEKLVEQLQRVYDSNAGTLGEDRGAGAGGGGDIIPTHDGLKWKKNPDGSFTQVQ